MPENQDTGPLMSYAKTRAQNISRKDMYFIAAVGFVIALLSLPILHNVGIPGLLASHGLSYAWSMAIWVALAPFGLLAMAYCLALLPFHHASAAQLSRYAVIGCFNVALNASIFNLLMLMSGISAGPMVTVFAIFTFFIVVTQSFFWSVFWTFRNTPAKDKRRQYAQFLSVSSIVATINIGIIYFMTSVVGAPVGISSTLWANIALLCTVFTALIGNFLGYKYLVFAIR